MICEKTFDKAPKAIDHVTSTHKVYPCPASQKEGCAEHFSEFDKLKAHLKAVHSGTDWPWICGFCDLVLFYGLEFEIHIKQHTDKAPFACPICQRLFSDNSRLREHLARQHLPSKAAEKQPTEESQGEDIKAAAKEEKPCEKRRSSAAQIKFEKQQAQLAQQQLQAFERLKASLTMTDKGPTVASAAAAKAKDEAAVSRELAALLLNLHDSNGRQSQSHSHVTKVDTNFPKAEDLSLKASSVETAIDLTKAKPEITLTPTMPASITKLVKGQSGSPVGAPVTGVNGSSAVTVTKTSVNKQQQQNSYPNTAVNSTGYPFYPSLAASMTSLSPTLAMNSNYLLHNLLLGKFQQIANNTTTASSSSTATPTTATPPTTSSSMALPTHPLPAQALSLPASKPPASVLKSAGANVAGSSPAISTNSTSTSAATSAAVAAAAAAGYNLQLLSEASSSTSTSNNSAGNSSSSGSGNSNDIPYMCRQIVTLLNGLLFHQHNLNNSAVEMNVQTQLGAIYTRLQEVVVMVEQAKKQQEAAVSAAASVAAIKATNSEAVAASAGSNGLKKDQLEKHLKDTQKQKEEEKIAKHIQEYQRALLKQHEHQQLSKKENGMATILDVVGTNGSLITQPLEPQVDVVDSMEDNAAENLKNRRRGRPPKNSNLDLSYSPPEKKMRSDMSQPAHQLPDQSSTKYNSSTAETSPTVAAAVAAVANHLNGVASTNGQKSAALAAAAAAAAATASTNQSGGSGKSGKGIRNRVFCGECTGCLKNDDCGKCRYCKDKTKFGGQNRLRQKCLHRRCQLDTHRRRSSQNQNANAQHGHAGSTAAAVSNGHQIGSGSTSSFSDNVVVSRQSPSPDAIYSGVALARLASQNLVVDTAEMNGKEVKNGQLSPGEIIRGAGQPVFPQGKKLIDYFNRPMETGISFLTLLFFLRVSIIKTQSKNTVRMTSFKANSTHARGRSGRMEIQKKWLYSIEH